MSRDTLLIVDDMEINRAILRALFEQEYNLLEAENGEQALMLLKQYHGVMAAVLLDLVMPEKNGYEVMEEMAKGGYMNTVPVIIITSEDSIENEVRAFDLGAADIIMKPFEPHVVKRRVQNAVDLNRHKLHLEDMVEEQAVKLRESREILMDTLSSIIEHRSVETGQHVLRIRMFTKVLLEDVMRSFPEYNLEERAIGIIASAAALHDIGKISIPDAILNKPGRLTDEEYKIMQSHSEKGCEILARLDRMDDKEYLMYAYNICRYHHERWDGRGYPDGLKGDNIPICAQAVGIADAYDALTTDRVYRKAIEPPKAITMILNGECGMFSPKLLECLKNVRFQFKELTQEYADGKPLEADVEKLSMDIPLHHPQAIGTVELGQMKYFTMLRYVNATVLEVDLDSSVYHVVYQQNNDFEHLRSSSGFKEAMEAFSEKSIHPEDRNLVMENLKMDRRDFLENGVMKVVRKYRVFHRTSGDYQWYQATMLRMNVDNPKQHKVLFIWEECEHTQQPQAGTKKISSYTESLLVGIQQCLNDKWYTIQNVNEGFVSLLGYSRQEIKERFHDHYVEMIHPDDREAVSKQFQKQMFLGHSQELEYRIVTKNGLTVWVLDKCQVVMGEDGREYMNCVLIDITPIKAAQEELRLTMERHKIIMDQSNDIIFEWDMTKDQISYSSNWEKKFGYQPITDKISVRIPQASHILPEDMPKFMAAKQEVGEGKSYVEAELRIAKADGRYLWSRIRATTQFDMNKKPIKAIGVILDIDNEKRRLENLSEQANRDALTKLYNKSAARSKIERILEWRDRDSQYAMLIIDLDNFKLINDTRGHMFGDAVLAEIASRLNGLFRAEDIVSRIGGDEFLVFIQNIRNRQDIQMKADSILNAFHAILADDLRDSRLSCSIGIACCPEDGEAFQDLFQCCDRALYQAKLRKKNQYVFYDKSTMSKTFAFIPKQALAASTRIESDDANDFQSDGIVLQSFKKLYESGDVEQAVNSILEMVGHKYNVSRAYIFENSEDGIYCTNTFEWCNEGIQPEIENLQHVTYEELGGNYQKNFDENGIFYCQDISKLPKAQYAILAPQGIRSLLQCSVRDRGKFVGYVGFDDCMMQRMWTQSQIDALTFISELLTTFLLKMRAQERALTSAQDLHMVLDNQNSWIYVIDPDSYELRYINAKTYEVAPKSKLGMPCHKAFFDRDTPCEMCPARGIREKINNTMEIYNQNLKLWVIADASFIRWGEKDACLLSCHNVTNYKLDDEKDTM